ncbi:isopenicillin N synthase family dioxygenase [Sporobolomyces koalae]|uniref:isopenicillin N synthase family dioxygenase n=1 Tax=Sporobolomyces koalae TaxID=500713 RepID=UPI0031730CE6
MSIRPDVSGSFPELSYAQAVRDPEAFVGRLRAALSTVGFFNLVDIDQVLPRWNEHWRNAFEASQQFFQLPLDTKNEIAMIHSRHFRGYAACRDEVTAGLPDWREQIDFGPDAEPVIEYPPSREDRIELSLYGRNLYPETPSTFEPAVKAYRTLCDSIAQKLVRLIGQSLSPEPELFSDLFSSRDDGQSPPYARLKIVQYPPVQPDEKGFGVGAHRDGGGLTLLAQDDSGGLQVQEWDGTWTDVPPIPYALVVNVGQVLENMSAGVYPATTHRVLKTVKPTPRISIPFFFSPALTARLVPLEPHQLHDDLRQIVETRKRTEVISEVSKGDLHARVYGISAWKGIKRSHRPVWEKFYQDHDPEA